MDSNFWGNVNKTGACWLWTGRLDAYGYGVVRDYQLWGKNGHRKAHRLSYEMLVGPIPDGLDIDHLCRVRNCVNPAHLEPVTRQVNLLRGQTIPAANAAKTHCPQGHPYEGHNLIQKPSGRLCRICQYAGNRARYHAKRLATASAERN